MRYELPLDDGRTAVLWLPRVLSPDDAQRMTAFIDALVMDELPDSYWCKRP
jgi:hypothetical protein